MLKKLDLLIVKAFIGPFIVTFFITLFVLVLQFMWLYIDDMVGKGLETLTVMRLVLYLSATLVPLALPLAVLLSSIMTLGNLGETYELVAIKSAGISLLRFMRPLFFVSLALTVIAFFFNNNVLPIANLKMNTLKYDIIVTKPAFDIKEGVFYDRIEGFVIKIGHKDKNDSTIRDVVIYEQNGGNQDNMIIADSGKMVVSADKQSLVFTLKSGTRYQEKATGAPSSSQLMRMSFKTYKKVMDLSSFRMNKTDDSTFKHNFQMLTLPQLGHSIDSIRKINQGYIDRSAILVDASLKFPTQLDDTSGWARAAQDTAASKYLVSAAWATDSIRKAWTTAHHLRDSTDKAQDARDKAIAEATKKAAQAAVTATHPPTTPTPPVATTTHPIPAATPPAATAAQPKPIPTAQAKPATAVPHVPPPVATVHPPIINHPPPITPTTTSPGHPTGLSQPQPRPVIPIPGGQAMNRLATLSKPPALSFADLLPDSVRLHVMEQSNNAISSAKSAIQQPALLYDNELNQLRQHEIAWHEKITLAVAVLVMFLIGAPLGSIIRKGGIGLPLVFAVVFFVIFFLLNNFGKKFVKEGVLGPIGGMWMATYVLTPIGIFLTYKAMNDSQLFNKEFYFRISRGIRSLIQKWRARRSSTA